MRKLISLILFVINVAVCTAQENLDYLYATDLQYDEEEELDYFDVYLYGSNIYYTGYGVDIKLPRGLECVTEDDAPLVIMLDADYIDDVIYPKKNRKYTHSVTPNFPTKNDPTHIRVGCMSTASQDLLDTKGALFRVYVNNNCNTNDWPIGEIRLYEQQLVQNIEGQVQPKTHFVQENKHLVVLHEGISDFSLSISSTNHWSTCILPFDAALPEGVQAYESLKHDEENLYLKEAKSIEAYTPYILYSEKGYSGTISGTVDPQKYPESGVVTKGYLHGAIVQQPVTSGYVLQNLSEGVKFYQIAEGSTFSIPAGKCWMTLPDASVKSLNFIFEDDEDAIVEVNDISVKSDILYNLSGQRVEKATKGIYIRKGKKVLY